MVGSTKYRLAEQILLKLTGGSPQVASKVQLDDIKLAIGQKINEIYKASHFSVTLASGETVPDGLMLATYTGIAVTSLGERSVATLPIMPISLPRNVGVFQVYDSVDSSNEYIPYQTGQYNLFSKLPLISGLLKQTGYEAKGNQLLFSRDITLLGAKTVNAVLAVMDISKYDDFTPLPISADMESTIVDSVYEKFAPVMGIPLSKVSDNYNSQPETAVK